MGESAGQKGPRLKPPRPIESTGACARGAWDLIVRRRRAVQVARLSPERNELNAGARASARVCSPYVVCSAKASFVPRVTTTRGCTYIRTRETYSRVRARRQHEHSILHCAKKLDNAPDNPRAFTPTTRADVYRLTLVRRALRWRAFNRRSTVDGRGRETEIAVKLCESSSRDYRSKTIEYREYVGLLDVARRLCITSPKRV